MLPSQEGKWHSASLEFVYLAYLAICDFASVAFLGVGGSSLSYETLHVDTLFWMQSTAIHIPRY